MTNRRRQLLLLIPLLLLIRRRRKTTNRYRWVRNWIARRACLGMSHTLVKELTREDDGDFRSMFRMDIETFENLLTMVTPYIEKEERHMMMMNRSQTARTFNQNSLVFIESLGFSGVLVSTRQQIAGGQSPN